VWPAIPEGNSPRIADYADFIGAHNRQIPGDAEWDSFGFCLPPRRILIAAAEAPTIVSEEFALTDDIRRYDAGMVVKEDVQQPAASIHQSLSNREQAGTLAKSGRQLAEERYPKTVGKSLHDLCRQVISKKTSE
jgi:hypothetical protein